MQMQQSQFIPVALLVSLIKHEHEKKKIMSNFAMNINCAQFFLTVTFVPYLKEVNQWSIQIYWFSLYVIQVLSSLLKQFGCRINSFECFQLALCCNHDNQPGQMKIRLGNVTQRNLSCFQSLTMVQHLWWKTINS